MGRPFEECAICDNQSLDQISIHNQSQHLDGFLEWEIGD